MYVAPFGNNTITRYDIDSFRVEKRVILILKVFYIALVNKTIKAQESSHLTLK